MKTDDYKRGVEDALEWTRGKLHDLSLSNIDDVKERFWHEHQQLTDDDRYERYKECSDKHILALETVMHHYERNNPGTFANDPAWFDAYIHWAWAKNLRGDQI